MFPFRHSSIFRSRWVALLWSAGFCWMALNVATSRASPDDGDQGTLAQQDATGETYTEKDVRALEQSLDGF